MCAFLVKNLIFLNNLNVLLLLLCGFFVIQLTTY